MGPTTLMNPMTTTRRTPHVEIPNAGAETLATLVRVYRRRLTVSQEFTVLLIAIAIHTEGNADVAPTATRPAIVCPTFSKINRQRFILPFLFGRQHPTMHYPAVQAQLSATLVNLRETNLSPIAIRTSWYPSKPYRRRLQAKYGSVPTMDCSIDGSNIQPPTQPRRPVPNTYFAKASAKPLGQNTKRRGEGDGNLGSIQP